jgi:ribulose bisphosphate carboxylase small subunit
MPTRGSKGVQRSPDDYYGPVQKFAADKYYIEQLQNALDQGWITKQEYDETIAKKTAASPQNEPTLAATPAESPPTI